MFWTRYIALSLGDGKHESGKADVKKNGAVAGGKKRDRRTQQKKDSHSSVFTHAWLASTLKGHAAPILALDFSPNGKQLVTCAEGDNAIPDHLQLGRETSWSNIL